MNHNQKRKFGKGKAIPKKHPRSTSEANAEHHLLRKFALELGQEAARQNDIPMQPTVPLTGNAPPYLVTINADQPLTLRATVEITVSPTTGAALSINLKHPTPTPNN